MSVDYSSSYYILVSMVIVKIEIQEIGRGKRSKGVMVMERMVMERMLE